MNGFAELPAILVSEPMQNPGYATVRKVEDKFPLDPDMNYVNVHLSVILYIYLIINFTLYNVYCKRDNLNLSEIRNIAMPQLDIKCRWQNLLL